MKDATQRKKRTQRQFPHKGLPPLDELQRYTIIEAADYLRVSRAYLYKLIRKENFPTIEDGSHRFVPGSAIAARCRGDQPDQSP